MQSACIHLIQTGFLHQDQLILTRLEINDYLIISVTDFIFFFQQFPADDYRNVRFIDKPKHVNENFAIKLIAEVPPKSVKERVVWCDGGGGPIGHPKVYINLDKPGNHTCGYCGLRFVKDQSH